MNRVRLLGLPLVSSLLLIAGAVKLMQAGGGTAAAGALFGCGLLLLGIGVRDWIEHHDHDDHDDRR